MRPGAILLTLALAGCAHPVGLTIIDGQTGEMAIAVIDGTKDTGPVSLQFHGESYTGVWTALRDPGLVSASFGQITGAGTPMSVSSFGAVSPNSGAALANLRSPSGKTLRCEIRYRIGMTITGLGACVDEMSRRYDVQVASQ